MTGEKSRFTEATLLPLLNISKLKMMEIIARVDMFKPLSMVQRELLLAQTKIYKCARHQKIQSPEDHNTHMYVLLTGSADVYKDGRSLPVGRINAGEFIGEGSFISGNYKSATAEAREECLVLCLDQDTLHGLPAEMTNLIKNEIIIGMAKRIGQLSDTISELQGG